MRTLTLVLICTAAAGAADWTRFRGPNGSGVSAEKGLPSEIGRDKNVLWSQKTLKGHSSPIVANGRVWITGHEGDDRVVLCYDASSGSLSGAAPCRRFEPRFPTR